MVSRNYQVIFEEFRCGIPELILLATEIKVKTKINCFVPIVCQNYL